MLEKVLCISYLIVEKEVISMDFCITATLNEKEEDRKLISEHFNKSKDKMKNINSKSKK